jgi:hypothetical protein
VKWDALQSLARRLFDHFMDEAFRLVEELGGSDAMTHAVEIEID